MDWRLLWAREVYAQRTKDQLDLSCESIASIDCLYTVARRGIRKSPLTWLAECLTWINMIFISSHLSRSFTKLREGEYPYTAISRKIQRGCAGPNHPLSRLQLVVSQKCRWNRPVRSRVISEQLHQIGTLITAQKKERTMRWTRASFWLLNMFCTRSE